MTPILLTYICFDNGFLYVLVILHFLKYLNLFNNASSAFETFGYHIGGSKIDPITYASFRYFSFQHYSWNPSLSKGKCKSVCSTKWRQHDCFSKPSYFWNPYTTLHYATLTFSTYPNTTTQLFSYIHAWIKIMPPPKMKTLQAIWIPWAY